MELKNIEIKDNYPLSIMLYGKAIWKCNNKSNKVKDDYLLDRQEDSCCLQPISCPINLYPSVDKKKAIDILQHFFSVCEEGLSPQSLWGTSDCDYESLLLDYDLAEDKKQFEMVLDEMTKRFPELKDSKNFIEKIPEGKTLTDMVSQIEVAYPCTWTVSYTKKAHK